MFQNKTNIVSATVCPKISPKQDGITIYKILKFMLEITEHYCTFVIFVLKYK